MDNPAYGGCTCFCHRPNNGGMIHFIACCNPEDDKKMPAPDDDMPVPSDPLADETPVPEEPVVVPAKMRAKIKVVGVEGSSLGENLIFRAIGKDDYSEDATDENNTYAHFTPQLDLKMYISNLDLVGTFKDGDTFYLDFIPAPK